MQDRKVILCSSLLIVFLFVGRAEAMCYSVYRGESLVFQSTSAPVDMGLPMSQAVHAKFGADATMMFNDGPCTEVAPRGATQADPAKNTASARQKLSSKSPPNRTVSLDEGQMEEARGAQNRDVMNNLSLKYGGLAGDSGQAGSSGAIQTGPRGGQFYINSNGNKTYVGSGGSGRSSRR